MSQEEFIKNSITEFSTKNREKTFAEFIAQVFHDKNIEIYLGDSYEEVSTDQVSTSYPAVFCGRVVAAFKECLVISTLYVEDSNIKTGNLVFINERSIRALTEIDGKGILEDMFMRSKESLLLKKIK